ncbi:MAG: transcription termination factor Rho [Desulfobacterales bacterium]
MKPVKGHLETLDKGFGFLRNIENNFQPSPEDTFVPPLFIRRFSLPEGVFIEGAGEKGDAKSGNLKLASIDTINGVPGEAFSDIPPLQDQISIHPDERLTLTQSPKDLMGRALDMIAPLGKGQRGLIVSPPKSGKTTVLKHMATSLLANHPDTDIFILLVDERPEEVTDFKRGLKDVSVIYSSADQSATNHMRQTRLAINTAMRCAETGRDAVIFIDSLTRMARAFNTTTNSHGRTLSGGLGANAMEIPRKVFGAARNIENGGSLTIMATILVDTGSRMDDIIFQEFKGTGNLDLVLSRECAEQRIFPAINISQSGTRNEQLLQDKEEYREITDIRRAVSQMDETTAMSGFLDFLDKG